MNTDRRWRAMELVQIGLAAVMALAGLALALLPHAWIEDRFGVDPDGGSGLLEFLPVVVLIAAAGILAVQVVRARSRRAAGEAVAAD